jgi:tetratricopeptide (TPR) repeat protein
MKIASRICAVFASVGMSMAAQAADTSPPPIPPEDSARVFNDAPAPWREYLGRVRMAERIADPLQRCLAFPDLPGNHWPAGHAAAHCRFHAQHDVPAVSLEAMAGYLTRGDTAALHAKLDVYLERHDAKAGLGEEIHPLFEQFGGDDRGDDISLRWLQQAPDDAYANLARGSYLLGKAWRERGKEYVADTSASNLENMQALVDRAVPLLQKAARLNPRLMPAYVALMQAAMLAGREDLAEASFAAAEKQSPACMILVRQRMQALLPRWGGSYGQAEAYVLGLAPYLKDHPGIALYFSMPYDDRASTFKGSEFYQSAAAALLDQAVDVGSYDDALRNAGDVALNRGDAPADNWRGFGLLLQEARFRDGNAWADKMIAWRLLRKEPEWALRYLVRAEKLEPADAELHYMLGAAYYNAHQYAKAQQHYTVAIADPKQRQASLRELSSMWLHDAELTPQQRAIKAKPFVDRLQAEYPDDGRGWIYRFDYLGRLGQRISRQQIDKFLAVADRTDPVQAEAIAAIESALGKTHAGK